MKPSPEQFAAICFLVLMDHHGRGYRDAHPNYIAEKLGMLRMGYEAYGMLDMENQRLVLGHLQAWRYAVPDEVPQPF